jgi:hypothetical protein
MRSGDATSHECPSFQAPFRVLQYADIQIFSTVVFKSYFRDAAVFQNVVEIWQRRKSLRIVAVREKACDRPHQTRLVCEELCIDREVGGLAGRLYAVREIRRPVLEPQVPCDCRIGIINVLDDERVAV